MSTESINTLGYYGKVPTHGDFVSKGLPLCFTDPWDIWLQEAIQTSQQQLGQHWLDYYLTCPLYHFALSPGICGNTGWLGILMPSVDKIGRYYPMTISLMINQGVNPFDALQRKGWLSRLENLGLSCLKDNYSLHEFNSLIDQLAKEIVCEPASLAERINNPVLHPAWHQSLNRIESVTDLYPSMLDSVLKEGCFAYSLWWTQGSEHVSPSFLFSEGLPPFDGVAAMLDGNWKQWGWEGNRYPDPFPEHRSNG
ncbi:MAG: type VI secretion system-associated protein TagF [Methylococcales bacterium]|nr:type VI secretion system-associated protein TagF [Methylococcales bacterium]